MPDDATATTLDGKFRVTTLPAPTTVLAPMVTPGQTMDRPQAKRRLRSRRARRTQGPSVVIGLQPDGSPCRCGPGGNLDFIANRDAIAIEQDAVIVHEGPRPRWRCYGHSRTDARQLSRLPPTIVSKAPTQVLARQRRFGRSPFAHYRRTSKEARSDYINSHHCNRHFTVVPACAPARRAHVVWMARRPVSS